jgi:hypothetical protein
MNAHRLIRPAILIFSLALSALLPLLVWLGYLRLEVPVQHWFLHDTQPPRPFLLLPLGALALLLALLGRALCGKARQRAGVVLLLAVVASFLMSVGVRSSSTMGFTTLLMTIIHEGSNSYYVAALHAPDPLALAHNYPREMPHLPLHATTQSPGAMLLHAGLHHVFVHSPAAMAFAEALLWLHPCHRPGEVAQGIFMLLGLRLQPEDVSAALLIALLFPFVMALGVLPLYGLARRLAGARVGLVLVGLYVVTPSFTWYASCVDQVYIFVALLVAWLCLVGVRERKAALLVIAGAITGLTVFLNLGFMLMAGIGTAFVFMLSWHTDRVKAAVGNTLLFAVCVFLALAAVCFAFSVNLPAVMAVSAGLRGELYHRLGRSYLTWLVLNPIEFSLGMGFSATALVLAGLALWRRLTTPAGSLLAAAVLALVGLALLGQVRAETSRMLMFVMPLLLASSAPVLRRLRLHHLAPALVLIVAQAVYTVVCYHLFDVWGDWILPLR